MRDEREIPADGMLTATPIDAVSLKHSPRRLGRERKIASDHDGRQAHPSAISGEDGLLTPNDILSRLRMTSAEPAKWMRRTFERHQVPYIHLCGQVRATEAQYQLLLKSVSFSPSTAVGRPASTTSKVESPKTTCAAASKRSVHERVTQMLLRTDDRT